MLDKLGKWILMLIVTLGVMLGAYLGLVRYRLEIQDKTVQLCVDLNDVKKIAAYEKMPIPNILEELKKQGINSLGIFEETLPDASAMGELYYVKGSGIINIKSSIPIFNDLVEKGLVKPERTYIFVPSDEVRKRITNQLTWLLGKGNVIFLGKSVLEINEPEEEIRSVGLGISEMQKKFILQKGFQIVPRVWNDPRYPSGKIDGKIGALADYGVVIFDGDEIFGFPDSLPALATALKNFHIKYGYLEIVKQDGDASLRKLMGNEVIRVHSVPKKELEKITRDEAIRRFVNAARERQVKLIYLRPFLPPQVEGAPVGYNLSYFGEVKTELQKAGFVVGRVGANPLLKVRLWQILILGLAVLISAFFLLEYFINIPTLLIYLLLILLTISMAFLWKAGYQTGLQKSLALLAAISIPAFSIISTFSGSKKIAPWWWGAIWLVVNVLMETAIGIFLLIGLLADSRFMLGVQTFGGVKLALVLPVLLVALYFILKEGEGNFKDRIYSLLNTQTKLITVIVGLVLLAALAVLVARSGNFVLPVPGFEKHFRGFLETFLFVRPRTKEFLVGYPFLLVAAVYYLRGKKKWLWLLAAIGSVAPISVFNTFTHIHTPLIISLLRVLNGLVLGVILGLIVAMVVNRFIKE